MNGINFNCGIVINGDYCQWFKDGRSCEPRMIHTRDGFKTAAEAEAAGEEAFAAEIGDGYHLITFYYEEDKFTLVD